MASRRRMCARQGPRIALDLLMAQAGVCSNCGRLEVLDHAVHDQIGGLFGGEVTRPPGSTPGACRRCAARSRGAGGDGSPRRPRRRAAASGSGAWSRGSDPQESGAAPAGGRFGSTGHSPARRLGARRLFANTSSSCSFHTSFELQARISRLTNAGRFRTSHTPTAGVASTHWYQSRHACNASWGDARSHGWMSLSATKRSTRSGSRRQSRKRVRPQSWPIRSTRGSSSASSRARTSLARLSFS